MMAAAAAMRLQGIVAREVSATDMAVVTVGAVHAGTKSNIIPSEADLLLSIRTSDTAVRDRVLTAIGRIVRTEAPASGVAREPLVERLRRQVAAPTGPKAPVPETFVTTDQQAD